MFEQWKQEIEADLEHFKRAFNQPAPPKPYEYGDGSGARAIVFEVTDDRCPMCGDEHDKSATLNGVVIVACPEVPEGWVVPLRRVNREGLVKCSD